MNKLIYIIIMCSLLLSRNFIYNEDSWYSVLAPKEITSMSYNRDKVFFSSTNGLFIFDKLYKDFYYADYIISNIENKDFSVVHYDSYRDNVWIANSEELLFKSDISNVWVSVYFNNLNITSGRNIKNIGSNSNYIILQIRNNQYIFLNPFTGQVINNIDYNNIENELLNVKWSSTNKSLLNNNIDLNKYHIFDSWNIISNNELVKNGKRLYVTCILNQQNGRSWIGTQTGDIFYAEQYSSELEKFNSIPHIKNINFAYLDDFDEWWIADKNWLYSSLDILFDQEIIFINHWNEKSNIWTKLYQTKYPQIVSKDINDIYRLENVLYVGTSSGLLIYKINLNKWELITIGEGLSSNDINDIDYNNNIVYIATSRGLTSLSVDINKPIKSFDAFHNKQIYDICFLDNYLYLATDVGLFSLDVLSNEVKEVSKRKFKKIEKYHNKIMLSKNNGIFVLEDDLSIQLLARFDNVKNFTICDNYIWVNNNNSAIIYNVDSGFRLTYSNDDGIVGDLINDIGCNESWVWFSTNFGLSFYNWRQYHYEK